jgi:hypothetical protein
MRCLYCGKELALLKRWTGGGEFCSDAHRQQYQEEYNRLALNRLLQAQTANSEKSEAKAKEAEPAAPVRKEVPVLKEAVKEAPAEAVAVETPKARPQVTPQAIEPKPEPARVESKAPPPKPAQPEPARKSPAAAASSQLPPEPEAEQERVPAKLLTFFLKLPPAAEGGKAEPAHSDFEFEHSFRPVLPERNGERQAVATLLAASSVALVPAGRIVNFETRKADRRVEIREFVRSSPVAVFDLRPAGETSIAGVSRDFMDMPIFPHPPRESAAVWQNEECSFAFETELGALARVVWGTTGIEDDLDPAEIPDGGDQPETATVAPASDAVKPEPAQVSEAPPKPGSSVTLNRELAAFFPTAFPVVAASAEKLEAIKAPPQVAVEVKLEPEIASNPRKAEPEPELAVRPLPMTLHALAAGRGKPVQVFPQAPPAGIDIQVPRSNALPLRPAMVLGAAVVPIDSAKAPEKKPEAANGTDSKRQAPARPEAIGTNGKGRKPAQEKQEQPAAVALEKRSEADTPAVAVAAKAEPVAATPPKTSSNPTAATASKPAESKTVEPEQVKAEKAKPETKVDPVAAKPAPLAAPLTPLDLGLPSLSIPNSGNFLTRLPMAVKAVAALVVVGGIAAAFYFGSSGQSAARTTQGTVVEAGTPLTAVDSGWITDWGAEPGVRRLHEISVLRPSLNLSDYRLEFQAQIETKALGWVFRAKDSKNYYVNRLEITKPGLDPEVTFARFAVIDGTEQSHGQVKLPMPLRPDTLYKIRFDAVGDKFTVYVQDRQIDQWTDARLKMGGVGLYNERGERMSLKGGVNVIPLTVRK